MAVLCLLAQLCSTLCDRMDCSQPDSSVHGDSPGKNTGVGCHARLQGIFPIQGLNPALSPTLQADSVPSEKLKYPGRSAHGWHLKNVCWMGRITESLNEKYM